MSSIFYSLINRLNQNFEMHSKPSSGWGLCATASPRLVLFMAPSEDGQAITLENLENLENIQEQQENFLYIYK